MNPRASLTTLLIVLSATACVSMPPADQPSDTLEGQRLTSRELRIRLYDFVVRFSSAIEAAADEIALRAEEPAVRERALLLKANAVPACESAAFDADPAVGLIDVWTLVARMDDYFGSEVAVEDFRELAAVGREVLTTLEGEVESIALELEGAEQMARRRDQIHAFAAQHPFDSLSFAPSAALPVLDLAQRASGAGLLEVAASADERLAEAQDRLTIYSASLPKQARWQAELLIEQVFRHPEVAGLTALAQDLPNLVATERALLVEAVSAEREAVLAAADAQRVDTLEFARVEREALVEAVGAERAAMVAAADAQRLDTLEFARAEREASVAALDEQRLATLAMLSDERRLTLADIDRQREATLAHLRAEREATLAWFAEQRNGSIDYASEATAQTSERVLGRAFLYALALVAVPALLLALVVLVCRPRVSLDLARRDPA